MIDVKTRSLIERKDKDFERLASSLSLTERKDKDFETIYASCKIADLNELFTEFIEFAQVKSDFIGFGFWCSILQVDTNWLVKLYDFTIWQQWKYCWASSEWLVAASKGMVVVLYHHHHDCCCCNPECVYLYFHCFWIFYVIYNWSCLIMMFTLFMFVCLSSHTF